MNLREYIWWASGQPWGWGTTPGLDCCKFVAKWVIVKGHVDPMVLVWRNPYRDEFSAMRRISKGGGLAQLWTDGMEHVGVPTVETPQPGDVGVLLAPTDCGGDEAMGIYTGERWMTLGERGINAIAALPVKVWRP